MALAARAKLWSTPPEVIEAAMDLLEVTEEDLLADLGCGNGGALFAAANRGASALGVEILPDRAAATAEKVKEAGLDGKINVVAGNALEADLSQVSCFFLYLIEMGLKKILPLLQAAGKDAKAKVRAEGGIVRVVTVQYRIPKDTGVGEPVKVARVYLKDRPEVLYLLHLYHIRATPTTTTAEAGETTTEAAATSSASE